MTEPVTTTYVRYLYPGIFFPEESVHQVYGRDPERIAREADPAVFAFEFFDRMRTATVVGGEEIAMDSGPIRKSGLYYIGWDPVLRCRTGNFRPLEEGDTVISSGAPTGG